MPSVSIDFVMNGGHLGDPDSPEHVIKNMPKGLLDSPLAKGRLDGLLKTSTPKGFCKSVDNLIIKLAQKI